MITYNQLATRAFNFVGKPNDDGTIMTNIRQDIMNGERLLKNSARRAWTRAEISTPIVGGQQDYQLPANCVRVTEVKVTVGAIAYPLTEMASEHAWNQQNIIPSVTIYLPTLYFIKGNNVLSLWPIPSSATVGVLSISYEPRRADYSLPDITGTATVSNGSTTVLDSATSFTNTMVYSYFTVTDGSDGNWYQIGSFDNSGSIELSNDYIGLTGGGRPYLIAACSDLPEEYHLGLAYYAAAQFYAVRKDDEHTDHYMGMFEVLSKKYKNTYSSKTTGVIQTGRKGRIVNLFGIPPFNLT